MLFLTSKLIEVPHGFSLRQGGVSSGPFASLNLSESVGDAPLHVRENLERLAEATGRSPQQLATVRQVHGDRVVRGVPGLAESADGLWTDDAAGPWLAVRCADCVPVLLSGPDGRRVAAVHSGWRGTALRVVARAVEVLVGQGERASTLRAAVGPCIQACCYEVEPQLAERFSADFGPKVVRQGRIRPHLDLSAAVRCTLLAAGLLPEWVDVFPGCTACEPGRFYSHRRDGGVTGRHLAFIAPTPLS